jgi:hypothetical protein
MVNLQQLGKETPPPVNSYAAGAEPPGKAPDLGVARGISNAVGEAEVLVVSPAERTISFYMEGMNAPMGSFRGYGKNPRGVETANRSLKETDPGVYTGRVRVPVAGVYDVAFFLDAPRLVHCFEATAEPNPALQKPGTAYELEFLVRDRDAPVGDNVAVRFRLDDARTGSGKEGLKDVSVLYYLSPGRYRTEVRAREVGGGVYEATLALREPGAYSVHVGVPSLRIGYDDFTQLSLVGRRKETPPAGAVPGEKGAKEAK